MVEGNAAARHCKRAFQMGLSLFRRGFNSSKCKTMAKMAVARIKLLRNKREVVVRQMRRDIAMLLESGQDATARIRVEHVIREQNIMAANEFIELFCELIVSRLHVISKQRGCPADLKEGISSLIFAGPRCSEIPELLAIRDVFQKKYGKDFVSAATDLRPDAGVNSKLIEKLSVRTPSGEVKMKVLREIAKEFNVKWDTTESEMELLNPPEGRIEGPKAFVSATSLPLDKVPKPSPEPNTVARCSSNGPKDVMGFKDSASAAEEAAASAKKAMAAAEAAAILANRESMSGSHHSMDRGLRLNTFSRNSSVNMQADNSTHYQASDDQYDGQRTKSSNTSENSHSFGDQDASHGVDARTFARRHSYNTQMPRADVIFDNSDCDEEIEMEKPSPRDDGKIHRRHSYNYRSAESGIKFDESDSEIDDEPARGIDQPPNRAAPRAPMRNVHPKLPDYDSLAARFESLKNRK